MTAVPRGGRLGRADFDAMVSDLAKDTSDRLGLEWMNDGSGEWAADVAGQTDFGPKLVYNGSEAVFSTCTDVVRWPAHVWDVNAYYAALGVPWWATRKQITEAYRDKVGTLQDTGDKVRLTYIFKVMLDPERRAKYDAVPLGATFVDPFVQEMIRIADALEASRKLAAGEVSYDELMEANAKLAEDEAILSEEALRKSRSEAMTKAEHMMGGGQWRWSFYVMNSRYTDRDADHEVLARWQALLVRYLSRKRKGVRIAVGFVGVTEAPYEVHAVGNRTVVFINDRTKPNRRLAKQAASAVVKHIRANRSIG